MSDFANFVKSGCSDLKCAGLNLIVCWNLKEHHIMIIIIKSHQGKTFNRIPSVGQLREILL